MPGSLGAVPSAPRPTPVPRPIGEVAALLGLDPGVVPADAVVTGVTHDSRSVQPGDLYAALPGFVTHGAEFVGAAAAAGAVAVLTDPSGHDRCAASGLPVLVVDDPRARLGEVAAWAYGRPGDRLLLIGVTGTNGKTTTSYLVEAGLRAAGHRTGLIGTTGTRIGDDSVATVRTTPESTDVHALLGVMCERGVGAVAMEVSSHALVLGRVDGLVFDVAVFTNLSRDHLDFHRDMDDYFAAKASLFTADRSRRAVIGVDDEWGCRLAEATSLPHSTFGLLAAADWHPLDVVEHDNAAQTVHLAGPDGEHGVIDLRLPGAFNVANAVAAFATLRAVGVSGDDAARGIASVEVPGRMEPVDRGQGFAAVVDYAHTPDAVERALRVARGFSRGRVIAVLGCGGDRDRDKRRPMGEVAARLADVLIVTDDNPRSEDPAAIRATILDGARGGAADSGADVVEIGDRRDALRAAVSAAARGDVVLVLGKGHEQGQEVGGVVHPFDDRLVLAEALEEVTA